MRLCYAVCCKCDVISDVMVAVSMEWLTSYAASSCSVHNGFKNINMIIGTFPLTWRSGDGCEEGFTCAHGGVVGRTVGLVEEPEFFGVRVMHVRCVVVDGVVNVEVVVKFVVNWFLYIKDLEKLKMR